MGAQGRGIRDSVAVEQRTRVEALKGKPGRKHAVTRIARLNHFLPIPGVFGFNWQRQIFPVQSCLHRIEDHCPRIRLPDYIPGSFFLRKGLIPINITKQES